MTETIFTKVDYDMVGIMKYISLGDIGLPEIQRPFIWPNAKVRNLFDSMYRGYPIGYFLFWQNAYTSDSRTIGTDTKQKPPRLLVVDGQQRLTSLYALYKSISIIRENYDEEKIEIAFSPLTEKFEVADAAIRRDKTYIPNISILWEEGASLFTIADSYVKNLENTREMSEEDIAHAKNAIQKVVGLLSYPFTALELNNQVNEEQVAEVFVRINSEGKKLNQADFILTLMSVFWDEGRTELEDFCRDARRPSDGEPSPYNHFIQPDPDQLLRVCVGLGFKRARLKYVYSILRGKDLATETFSTELRDKQFGVLKDAQKRVLDVQYWHDFLNVLRTAGFRSGAIITSHNNVLFTYILYLIGRTEFKIDEHTLRQILAQWFFMSNITGRYTSSPESKMEFDLNRLRLIDNGEDFCRLLSKICREVLTNDYWTITLPGELATAAAKSPSQSAYFASLNLLEAKVLFSKQKVSDLLDISVTAKRKAVERHHLFPKNHLKDLDIQGTRRTNQIANYALVEWGDNAKAKDDAPSVYLPYFKERFSATELERMYYWHALPDGWESMEYEEFLIERRERIANVIADAYKLMSSDKVEDTLLSEIFIDEIIEEGEGDNIEFKSTLRRNLHTGENDNRMELSCLKTIAGFLNHKGGTLLIGVTDDGEAVGIEEDKFPNEDKMYLHLVNLLKAKIGPQFMMYIHPHFEDYDDKRVLAVICQSSRSPVFLKDGKEERFYVRTGAATNEITGHQAQDYIKHRFK